MCWPPTFRRAPRCGVPQKSRPDVWGFQKVGPDVWGLFPRLEPARERARSPGKKPPRHRSETPTHSTTDHDDDVCPSPSSHLGCSRAPWRRRSSAYGLSAYGLFSSLLRASPHVPAHHASTRAVQSCCCCAASAHTCLHLAPQSDDDVELEQQRHEELRLQPRPAGPLARAVPCQ